MTASVFTSSSQGLRYPAVAGRFYPDDPDELRQEIVRCTPPDVPDSAAAVLAATGESIAAPVPVKPRMVLLPHAGYYYCGEVIGATLAEVTLPERLILLGPNHTGEGAPLALWNEGAWQTPLGSVPVDGALTSALLEADGGFTPDTTAHRREHSLEVLLPFLQLHAPDCRIVPVCVGTGDGQALVRAGAAVKKVLEACAGRGEKVAVIVSSDMHHFSDHKQTLALDTLALNALTRLNPQELGRVVHQHRISMCGVCPAILALCACVPLGTSAVRVVKHSTSGTVSGEMQRVVGYAGLYVW